MGEMEGGGVCGNTPQLSGKHKKWRHVEKMSTKGNEKKFFIVQLFVHKGKQNRRRHKKEKTVLHKPKGREKKGGKAETYKKPTWEKRNYQ